MMTNRPPSRPSIVRRSIRLPQVDSLIFKLTLAFLCVGLIGALLVAFFVGQRTQQAFGQFVDDRDSAAVTNTLAQYYATHGTWLGVEALVQADENTRSGDGRRPRSLTLVTPDGQVVVADGQFRNRTSVAPDDLDRATPIIVQGTTVGLILNDAGAIIRGPGTPEGNFIDRIWQALVYSAVGATTIALLLGFLLARTLTRPLRELTAATEALANGELGQQVAVRSHDEIGTLATSFNRMSADLAQASRSRRQMTADIAHDLRTPLSVILGYTEALREGKLPPDQDTFDTMYSEAQHLQHLIDDLRILSLADAGELPLTRQVVEPSIMATRAAAAYSAPAQAQGVALEIAVAPALPTVYVDTERMAQVFGNLLNNALRYTPTGGTIRIQVTDGDGMVRFAVRDTGSGIAAEAVPHVFERLYRADAARQHNGSSGLGLAIVKSIVEAHGGSVGAESSLGHGSTFTLSLPAYSKALSVAKHS